MDIDRFVSTEEDIAYEYELQSQAENFVTWTRYLEYKKTRGDTASLSWLYERCCYQFPENTSLWLEYLKWRTSILIGVNPVLYVDEFTKCNTLFEKALCSCYQNDEIWMMYLKFVQQQRDLKMVRSILDRSLRCLPLEKHPQVWKIAITFTEKVLLQNETFLQEEEEIDSLVHTALFKTIPKSAETIDAWSAHMLVRYIPVTDDLEHALYLLGLTGDEGAVKTIYQEFIFAGDFVTVNHEQFNFFLRYIQALEQVGTNEEFIEGIKQTVLKFPQLWSNLVIRLSKFYVMRSDIALARSTLQDALQSTLKTKDFSLIYDFYVNFLEVLVEVIVQELRADPEYKLDWEQELSYNINLLEHLMDTHELKLNDLKIRQDSNNVITWIERADLFSSLKEKCEVYAEAILKIDPSKVNEQGQLGDLWCHYARLYMEVNDFDTARETLDHALRVPFKYLKDLETIWLCWAQMELEIEGIEKPIKLLKRALQVPKAPELILEKYNGGKRDIPAQSIIFSSLNLWSFYLDLLEASCNDSKQISETRRAYDQAITLKLATPLIFINYAHFLQAHDMWEESFQVYERAIAIFPVETKFELWNIYLGECVKKNLSTERMRDLFEQAIELVLHGVDCTPFFVLYSHLEETNNLHKRSVDILHRGCRESDNIESKFALWQMCIETAKRLLGNESTRSLYEECIKTLPNSKAIVFVVDFAKTEEQLEAYDRARAVLKFGAQILHPDQNKQLWQFWNDFELRHGNKSTYKDMLKLKRHVSNTFKVDTEEVSSRDGNIAFIASASIVGGNAPTKQSNGVNPEEISLDL